MKKQCSNCHKPITDKRGDARFCSRECRNAYAYRLRKGQVKDLESLSGYRTSNPEINMDKTDISEITETLMLPEPEKTVHELPSYKTPTVDSDSIADFLGDTDIQQDKEQNDTEEKEEVPPEQESKPLPQKYIQKQIQTDNPLYTRTEAYLKNQQVLKQKLEQDYAKLEAELKFQESRTGNEFLGQGALAGSIVGWVNTPFQLPGKAKKDKPDMILKNKDGNPILKSIKNKWKKIKSKKNRKKQTPTQSNEPSFLQKLGGLLLYGAIGASVGMVTKAATEDFRERDKKEKIAAIKKRMEEVRRSYAIVKSNISATQKQLGQIPRYLLSNKTELNPDYQKALAGIPNGEQNSAKSRIKLPMGPSRFRSDKVIKATDLANMTFSALDFKGFWKDFFGLPSTNFHVLIHGNSGEGKSTFCLWFAKYLAENFGVVLYVSGEEGTNKTFYDKLKFCSANVEDLHILDVRTGDEFMQEINENEAHFIFLDSLHDMDINAEKLKQIFQKYKNSAFICIDQNNKKGDLLGANEKKHLCDVVVNVINYTAETTKNRFKQKGMVFKTEEFPGSEKGRLF